MSRPYCPHCLNPLQRCFCQLVTPVPTTVEVVFWQHPSEAGHPKGTLPLLHHCLPNSQLVCAEQLSEQAFASTLAATATPTPERQLQLLFPPTDEDHNRTSSTLEHRPSHIRLLVLDGTWRKARKLVHLNPWLLKLPRRSLPATTPSRYGIRKAEKPGQLSTLEATCAALTVIEADPDLTTPILAAFEHYINQLKAFRPDTQ